MDKEQLNQQIALFYFGYRTFTETADLIIAKHQLKRLHHRILFFTARMPGLTIHDLLMFLEISKQALHKPLAELRERELIRIEEGQDDRRNRCLFLTAAGNRLERELGIAQQKQMEQIFNEIGGDAATSFKQVMEAYAANRPGTSYIKDFKE